MTRTMALRDQSNTSVAERDDAPEPAATLFDLADTGIDPHAIVDVLATRGFVVLRNVFARDVLEDVRRRARHWLSRPAVAGTIGYGKVDGPKRLLNPAQIGGPVVDVLVNETVLDIVEAYMQSECVLSEAILKFDAGVGYEYFPLHADFTEGWTKGGRFKPGLTRQQLSQPVGVGGALYLEDSTEGAFSYCDGTHAQLAPHGQDISGYPPDERRDIEHRKIRCDGRAGDLVLFDDRGFHGPDQPSSRDRTVILLDYYRVATFGHVQVAPMPLWSTDIGRLNERQRRAIGIGADYWFEPEEYTGARFRKTRAYRMACWLVEHAYTGETLKRALYNLIRR